MKLSTTMILLTFFATLPAFGQARVQQEIFKRRHQLAAHPVTGCVDFSGDWHGQCRFDGEVFPDSTAIYQLGCKYFLIDGDIFGSGYVDNVNSTNAVHTDDIFKDINSSYVRYVNWNTTKTVLETASYVTSLFGELSTPKTYTIHRHLFVDDQDRLTKQIFASDGFSYTCTYER